LAGLRAHRSADEINTLRRLGHLMGLAFQIGDDILDVTSDSETMGKSIGKDQEQGKSTYPSLLGLEGAREHLNKVKHEASQLIAHLRMEQTDLPLILTFLSERKH
jgi:geranylgeranyl pyrophosphate synthase